MIRLGCSQGSRTRCAWPFLLIPLAAIMLLSGCATTPTDTPPTITIEAPPSSDSAGKPTETIVILHTNDFHGAVEPEEIQGSGGTSEEGGLVNMVSLIDQLRDEHPDRTLLLDAGDTFQGTYVSNSTEGELVMAAMNLVG